MSLPTDFNTFDHCGCPIRSLEAKLVSVPEMGYLVTDTVHGRVVDSTGAVQAEGIPCEGRGEACFRGLNVIQGYYRRPEINAATFDAEGWYHSGDIAIWNQYGGLQIVDRKKDIFKLSQGEYISPDKVTGVYLGCPLVGNLYVYGDSYQSYLVAVVVPSEEHLRAALRERGMEEMEGRSFAELCKDPDVKAVMFEEMGKVADASKWAMRSGSFAAFGIKADYSDLPNRDLSRGPVTHIEQNPATKEWEITFRLPFRKTYAKGTAVRQHIGPQYQYLVSGKKLSEEWQEFSGIFSGTPMSAETGFRRGVYPGTESVRLVLFVPGAKRTFEFKEIKITAME